MGGRTEGAGGKMYSNPSLPETYYYYYYYHTVVDATYFGQVIDESQLRKKLPRFFGALHIQF
jgi:hypothetical protein